jgi:membrane protease subunit (stomatin/prohibitin family)
MKMMAERHAAKAAAAVEKAAAANATAEAAYAHENAKCSDCGRKFFSGGDRRNQFCPKFEGASAKRRLMLHLLSMLVASDAHARDSAKVTRTKCLQEPD